jgi:hypothetical protein
VLIAADELAQGSLEAAERYLGLAARGSAPVPAGRHEQLQVLLKMVRLLLARQRGNPPAVAEEARRLQAIAEAPDAALPGLGEELRGLALISLGITEVWAAQFDVAERHLEQGVALARRIGRPFLEFSGLAHQAVIETYRSFAQAAERSRQAIELREARVLAFRPLELAHAGHKPLAAQGVTLIMDQGTGTARESRTGDRLRVLGLFSLPEGSRALNLRRERYDLVRLFERIEANGKAVHVRVLQYGVTRGRLRAVLQETEGWNIIHISGHGAPAELLLETDAGQPDRVAADDLASLLDLARERVALVTVSACWSGALAIAEQRRLLDLPIPEQDPDTERTRGSPLAGMASGALATELAGGLNCAVLAMRYPVNDDFAIALSGKFYELLAGEGQPLPRKIVLDQGRSCHHRRHWHPALQ